MGYAYTHNYRLIHILYLNLYLENSAPKLLSLDEISLAGSVSRKNIKFRKKRHTVLVLVALALL